MPPKHSLSNDAQEERSFQAPRHALELFTLSCRRNDMLVFLAAAVALLIAVALLPASIDRPMPVPFDNEARAAGTARPHFSPVWKVLTLTRRSPAFPISECWLLTRILATTWVIWSASAITASGPSAKSVSMVMPLLLAP